MRFIAVQFACETELPWGVIQVGTSAVELLYSLEEKRGLELWAWEFFNRDIMTFTEERVGTCHGNGARQIFENNGRF